MVFDKEINTGFTLIELLVVISIISFLSSAGMFTINTTRLKARNIERIIMIKTFEKGLAMYYDDYGHYPKAGGHGWYKFKYERNQGGSCAGADSLGISWGGIYTF